MKPFGEDIWIVDGSTVSVAGFRYPTRMAVIRLADKSLFIWSPTKLDDALRAEVNALGPVRHIVAPNSLHHLFLAEWKGAYPTAKLHAPPGLRKKRKDLAFDDDLADTPNTAWANDIDQAAMLGNAITTEIVFFHKKSATVLFCDLLQQLPEASLKGWRKLVAKLDLMIGPEPQVPRKFRVAWTNRRAARAGIEKVQAWPAEKVLMAHGTPVETDGKTFLRRAFAWAKA